MLSGNEIREKFLTFFEGKGHTRVRSSSLVPHNDPTLLFTNAGMNQFKDVFLGLEKHEFTRATTAQKCVRAGGKHNDLDSVGRTARHHTFFEMLGNFSFGDYFKRDAIIFAWEFLVEVVGLPAEKLYATVYTDDDEAFDLWQELTSIPKERIIRLGEKDNFWSMGDTGPCGPCSEVLIDRGEQFSCGPNCGIGICDCDRFLEIWNLVFMQYNRDEKGNMTPLPRPSIDTGMGLERLTAVIQGVNSNYDTDLVVPILQAVEKLCGQTYYQDQRGFPFRVVADHIRSCTFLIADGVLPGNEGRGYVLRRILRRAVRFGKVLNIEKPFMFSLVPVVVDLMGDSYPELREKADYVARVIRLEEERFHETLNEGIRLAQNIIDTVKEKKDQIIPGEEAFRLYDTYGFPLDLTQDIAEEAGLEVDLEGFNKAMEIQKQRARASRQENRTWDLALAITRLAGEQPPSQFMGYESTNVEAELLTIVKEGELAQVASEGDEVYIILDRTSFYPEGGGQAGDHGEIIGANGKVSITAAIKMPDGKIVHEGTVKGMIKQGERIIAAVEAASRAATARNHTATHLLHKALREILGDHVHQAGSAVDKERLRFDFTHFTALDSGELQQIEDMVNEKILAALSVEAVEAGLDEAKEMGAMALFGEKYGDRVRVVRINDYSLELCGGTHVANTSQIGLLKIISEGAVGAGLRRIEAVTGMGVRQYIRDNEKILEEASLMLKTPQQEVIRRISSLLEDIKQKERALNILENNLAKQQAGELINRTIAVNDIKVLAVRVDVRDMDGLRNQADMFREKLESGIVVLGTVINEKVSFIVTVSKDLNGKGIHAGKIIKEVAGITGGSGGGRPDMAQAGGKDVSKLDEALQNVPQIVEKQMK